MRCRSTAVHRSGALRSIDGFNFLIESVSRHFRRPNVVIQMHRDDEIIKKPQKRNTRLFLNNVDDQWAVFVIVIC